MSIVGAAFLPHAPLLLPTTDPEHQKVLRPLRDAYIQAAQWIHAAQPDCIVCCNPHAPSIGNTFTFNLAREIQVHFEEFGDLTTSVILRGSPTLAFHLKELLEPHLPVAVSHNPTSNYGVGIPALMMQRTLEGVPWVEISCRQSSPDEHLRFGALLQNELLNARQRIVLVASGEVSANAAKPFCENWNEHSRRDTLVPFLEKLTADQTVAAQSCGAWSVAQVLGAVRSLRLRSEMLYNNAPYGTAYQVMLWQPV